MATTGEVLRRHLPEKAEIEIDLEISDQFSSSISALEELHVLAVDDSQVDRKVIERLLKVMSCKVTTVESGKRALQFLGLDGEKSSVGFDGLKVNLIITDYSMPGMTGYELLKKIKESSAFREIPVVIMSSENILPRIDRCLQEGAEEYIMKPVKLADVKRLKDFITRGSRSVEERRIKRKFQDVYSIQPLLSPLLPPQASSSSSAPVEASTSSPSILLPISSKKPRFV